jgi:hypothetical protein
MAPKRTTRRERKTKTKKADIRVSAMEMVNLAYEQSRYQDALEGLQLLKTINHGDNQAEWEIIINKLIKCCREQME